MKTYIIKHLITIEQEIPARSKAEALRKYKAMIEDAEARAAVTAEDCTSSSSTDWEIEVFTPSEIKKGAPFVKVTGEDVLLWLGYESSRADACEIIAEVARGIYSVRELANDISDFA